jgi:hypothetical protein
VAIGKKCTGMICNNRSVLSSMMVENAEIEVHSFGKRCAGERCNSEGV